MGTEVQLASNNNKNDKDNILIQLSQVQILQDRLDAINILIRQDEEAMVIVDQMIAEAQL